MDGLIFCKSQYSISRWVLKKSAPSFRVLVRTRQHYFTHAEGTIILNHSFGSSTPGSGISYLAFFRFHPL